MTRNFLNTDELAIFRCDGNDGTESCIAKGPCRSAYEAFDRAFNPNNNGWHDYEKLHTVLRLDTTAMVYADVTEDWARGMVPNIPYDRHWPDCPALEDFRAEYEQCEAYSDNQSRADHAANLRSYNNRV